MRIIKCLSELIEEELHDAEHYADLAMKYKTEAPETADLFYQLSTEEMGHVDKLHKRVTELIEQYRQTNGEPPAGMLVLYEYLHNKHIAQATQIRIKQGMYKAT